MVKLFKSSGVLRYSQGDFGYRLVMDVDKDFARYYRSMIPKWIYTNGTRYAPHVTIVRPEKEMPVNLEPWARYEGEEVPFEYEGTVHSGKVYYWLNVFCVRLENIRRELGLPVRSEFTIPPSGFTKCFHMTIANCKK